MTRLSKTTVPLTFLLAVPPLVAVAIPAAQADAAADELEQARDDENDARLRQLEEERAQLERRLAELEAVRADLVAGELARASEEVARVGAEEAALAELHRQHTATVEQRAHDLEALTREIEERALGFERALLLAPDDEDARRDLDETLERVAALRAERDALAIPLHAHAERLDALTQVRTARSAMRERAEAQRSDADDLRDAILERIAIVDAQGAVEAEEIARAALGAASEEAAELRLRVAEMNRALADRDATIADARRAREHALELRAHADHDVHDVHVERDGDGSEIEIIIRGLDGSPRHFHLEFEDGEGAARVHSGHAIGLHGAHGVVPPSTAGGWLGLLTEQGDEEGDVHVFTAPHGAGGVWFDRDSEDSDVRVFTAPQSSGGVWFDRDSDEADVRVFTAPRSSGGVWFGRDSEEGDAPHGFWHSIHEDGDEPRAIFRYSDGEGPHGFSHDGEADSQLWEVHYVDEHDEPAARSYFWMRDDAPQTSEECEDCEDAADAPRPSLSFAQPLPRGRAAGGFAIRSTAPPSVQRGFAPRVIHTESGEIRLPRSVGQRGVLDVAPRVLPGDSASIRLPGAGGQSGILGVAPQVLHTDSQDARFPTAPQPRAVQTFGTLDPRNAQARFVGGLAPHERDGDDVEAELAELVSELRAEVANLRAAVSDLRAELD